MMYVQNRTRMFLAHHSISHPFKWINVNNNNFLQGLASPVLVFVQSKERAQELFEELLYDGLNIDVIHADRTQLQVIYHVFIRSKFLNMLELTGTNNREVCFTEVFEIQR